MLAGRGSRLAVRQTEIVAELLRRAHPGIEIEILAVTTAGDRDQRPFGRIGGRGLFVAEVEKAVLDGRADAAVHSAKDLTAQLAPGAVLVCVPAREDPRDAVVGGRGPSGEERLARLPAGARVGTSSVRRRALIAEAHPDLEVVDFRGNLDTRLRKVSQGTVAAAVVAAAGLARLDAGADAAPIDPARWLPPPGQGALAVEAASGRADVARLFEPLDDPAARAEVTAERAFSARLEGGCTVPLGCLARAEQGGLIASGYLGLVDGSAALRDRISGSAGEAENLGRELAEAMLSSGGDDMLAEIRASEQSQPAAP